MALAMLDGLIRDLTDHEIIALVEYGNRLALKGFLAECMRWRLVSYDQSSGLMSLIERAVGLPNIKDINPEIMPERYPLKGTDIRLVTCRVEAYRDGETCEQAAQRLTDERHVLANTGDLACFLHDYPDEVEKWEAVHALSKDSRWARPGRVRVPCVYVNGARRLFSIVGFRDQHRSDYGVLVLRESGT